MFFNTRIAAVAALSTLAAAAPAPAPEGKPFQGDGTLQVHSTNGTNIGCLFIAGFFTDVQSDCETFHGEFTEAGTWTTFIKGEKERPCEFFQMQWGAPKNFVCTPKVEEGFEFEVQGQKVVNPRNGTIFQLGAIGHGEMAILEAEYEGSRPVELWWKSSD